MGSKLLNAYIIVRINALRVASAPVLTNTPILFSYAEGMHAAEGERIKGFEVAGADGLYHAAEATVCGSEIRLHCPEVERILSVRYAWQPYTHANLVNAANLPASTFRDEHAE